MPSPIDLQKALSGVDYPADKATLIQHAKDSGAGKDVLDALENIEDRQYDGPSGVSSSAFD